MASYFIIKGGLVLHLSGITLMVGIAIAYLAIYRQSWKLLAHQTDKAFVVLQAAFYYPRLQMVGVLLVLMGGVLMMLGYHGAVMHLLWFKIKLLLILAIVVSQWFMGMPAAKQFRRILLAYQQDKLADINGLKNGNKKLVVLGVLQLCLFLLIFILSAFRFT